MLPMRTRMRKSIITTTMTMMRTATSAATITTTMMMTTMMTTATNAAITTTTMMTTMTMTSMSTTITTMTVSAAAAIITIIMTTMQTKCSPAGATRLPTLDSGEYGAVLRAKGIVDGGDTWYEFDMVPGEHEIRTCGPDVTGKVCVIGSQLKEHEVEELFHA